MKTQDILTIDRNVFGKPSHRALDRIVKAYERIQDQLESERAANDWNREDARKYRERLVEVRHQLRIADDCADAQLKRCDQLEQALQDANRRVEGYCKEALLYRSERDLAREALKDLASEAGLAVDTDAEVY
jgi:chromosome segregation ATPase